MPPKKKTKLTLKLPAVPEPEIRTSTRQRKPSAKATPQTAKAKIKKKASTKAPPAVALASTFQDSSPPLPVSDTAPAVPSPFVTISQKIVKPGPAARPSSTTDTEEGRRGGSDGDDEEEDNGNDENPLAPIESVLPPPFRSPHMRRASGQKRKQDGINTDVSDYLFCLLSLLNLC